MYEMVNEIVTRNAICFCYLLFVQNYDCTVYVARENHINTYLSSRP